MQKREGGGNIMRIRDYDRTLAVGYARKWALGRNPAYYDFDPIGGDCTNFISQCLFAGAGQMNFTPVFGWYYLSLDNRAPAWTGVEYLHNFLVGNRAEGPFALETGVEKLERGDVIQLGSESGNFYHSLLVTEIQPEILVCAHTFDALDKPLAEYYYDRARFLHVEGVRKNG